MPSILSDDDKQTVKRTVPKANNKIHAVAVAKLYISLPHHPKWTPTGLQGAAVLANDLVGNTFWLKLVDVSPSNRGVLWDQEIYDTFQYNQDRTFFHSFEGEECLFGLSFADEKEARQFKKKMEEREKNASKATRAKPFAAGPAQTGYGGQQATQSVGGGGGKSHGRFGGLFSSHKHGSGSQQGPAQSIIPPRGVEIQSQYGSAQASPGPSRPASSSGIDLSDPDVQAVLQDLLQMGITEDQVEENAGFIKSYLEQKKATSAADAEKKERANRAPPPPPPTTNIANLSPQNTGSSSGDSNVGPPPPPRPPKTPMEEESHAPPAAPPRFGVPPPFEGKRITSGPPPTPARGGVPPPPPPRDSSHAAAASAATAAPGRGGLLADIQRGARLKKVNDQEKRDRSAALVPGGEAAPVTAGGGGGGKSGGGDGGGLANALADALAARKSKVSHSE
ncbi:hypothetical protein B0A55_09953 [Friedmanniomyces simplex]|uniref:WH1 domain-containing protein n=1 Tax=Friedmanniomyces simplex TaxID=329884 RepID=A0A4U0X856_9PEZI|nr:hypothetical protein B0A55_09953 [Friedmanniomyces simplex]